MAGDREEGVQCQRVHLPAPQGLTSHQPLSKARCHGSLCGNPHQQGPCEQFMNCLQTKELSLEQPSFELTENKELTDEFQELWDAVKRMEHMKAVSSSTCSCYTSCCWTLWLGSLFGSLGCPSCPFFFVQCCSTQFSLRLAGCSMSWGTCLSSALLNGTTCHIIF